VKERPASVQHLGIIRRLRRGLDRDRLERPAVGLGAAMRGALGNHDEIAGLHCHFLVAEPDRPGAFEDVLDLVGVGMHVLADIAVLDRNRGAVGGEEHLGMHAAGIGRTQRVSGKILGVNELRHDGFGGQRRPHQMCHAASGGKGGGDS